MILLNTFSLIQALAELYVIDGQYEKAFSLYADVSVLNAHSQKKKKEVFMMHRQLYLQTTYSIRSCYLTFNYMILSLISDYFLCYAFSL